MIARPKQHDAALSAAYLALAERYRHDVAKEPNDAAEAQFRKIEEAYEILRNALRRRAYDTSRSDQHFTEVPAQEPGPRFRADDDEPIHSALYTAYLALATELYRPEVAKEPKDAAEAHFRKIKEADEILRDALRRWAYDNSRSDQHFTEASRPTPGAVDGRPEQSISDADFRAAATLSESDVGDIAPSLAAATDESKAVNSAPVPSTLVWPRRIFKAFGTPEDQPEQSISDAEFRTDAASRIWEVAPQILVPLARTHTLSKAHDAMKVLGAKWRRHTQVRIAAGLCALGATVACLGVVGWIIGLFQESYPIQIGGTAALAIGTGVVALMLLAGEQIVATETSERAAGGSNE